MMCDNHNIDLNIDNYSLEDLLSLFKIDSIDSVENLSRAKTITLKMHPDKSGLDKEYFLFFSKAYKTLYNLHTIQDKTRERGKNTDYENYKETMDSDNRIILDKIKKGKQSIREFNEWFNQEFESMRIKDEFAETGYGEWIKCEAENKVDYEKPTYLDGMHKSIEQRKRDLYQIVRHEEIQDYNDNTYCDIGNTSVANYSSGLFSGGLAFQDLKQAHTETVIPVDERDADKRQTTFDIIKHERGTTITPLDERTAITKLNEEHSSKKREDIERMYNMLRQQEQVEKNNQEWWKKYKLLKG